MTCILIVLGNLGKDPEIKQTQNGEPFAKFSIAINKWKGGEKTTMWLPCLVFDAKKVEVLQNFARKGSKVFLEGELEIRSYTAQDGVEKQVAELVVGRFNGQLQLLDRKDDTAPQPGGGERRTYANGPRPAADDMGLDDSIPF